MRTLNGKIKCCCASALKEKFTFSQLDRVSNPTFHARMTKKYDVHILFVHTSFSSQTLHCTYIFVYKIKKFIAIYSTNFSCTRFIVHIVVMNMLMDVYKKFGT